jgi:hypothetical protein
MHIMQCTISFVHESDKVFEWIRFVIHASLHYINYNTVGVDSRL